MFFFHISRVKQIWDTHLKYRIPISHFKSTNLRKEIRADPEKPSQNSPEIPAMESASAIYLSLSLLPQDRTMRDLNSEDRHLKGETLSKRPVALKTVC